MKKISSNLIGTLNLLNDMQYHDGDTIGQHLNISRNAIWKIINKLKYYDIPVNSIKGKGYALQSPLIILDENYLKKELEHLNIEIEVFETINSTSAYLKNNIGNKIRVCLAEFQDNGKGRFGRKWHSPFGQNLYLSCCYPFVKDPSELAGLTLVVSLALIKALNQFNLPQPLLVKWPNDIIYQNSKLVGSLIEVVAESHGMSYAIIGIGINVNMQEDLTNQIQQKWCSLGKILNCYLNRNQLCVTIIKCLISYLEKFSQEGFNVFKDEWNKYDALANKEVSLLSGNEVFKGIALGVNNFGQLIVKLSNDEIRAFSSAEVTMFK